MRLLVNLNETVKVRLTEAGRKVYLEYWAPHVKKACGGEVPQFLANKFNATYLEVQLHELMHVFGPHATVGAPNLFEDNDVEVPVT